MARAESPDRPHKVCSATFIAWSAFRGVVLAGLGGLLAIVWAGGTIKNGYDKDISSVSGAVVQTNQRVDKLEYNYTIKSDSILVMMTRMTMLIEAQNRQLRIINNAAYER